MSNNVRTAANWWKLTGDIRAKAIWLHLAALEQRQRVRVVRDQINERIYSSNVSGARGSVDIATMLRSIGFQSADLNFTRTIVDAMIARICNDQPAVHMSADGADWTERRQAQVYDKVIAGEFEGLRMEEKAPLCARAALTSRWGAIHTFPRNGDIVAERVPADETLLDEREGRYGAPRQLHRWVATPREVLLRDHPDHAQAIEEASPAEKRLGELDDATGLGGESNMIDVAESWHLPSAPEAPDGVWVKTLRSGVELDSRPWKRPRFPIHFIRWSPPMRGFSGPCLVDELAALQFKVNEIARDLLQNVYWSSAMAVFTRRSADISKKKLSGKQPYFVEIDNPGDVQFHAPDGFSPAQFQLLQWLIQQMFEVSGVSQLMAQSKNPLGANASGAALANIYDMESERFSQFERAYATFWKDTARGILDAAQDLSTEKSFRKREVRWNKQGIIRTVKWSDVNLDMLSKDDKYQLHLEASGYLPNTRTGKLQAIEQLIAGGFLDPKWAPSLLDFPDLEQANLIRRAPIDYAIACQEDVLDCEVDEDGEVKEDESAPVPAPIPEADLELCMAIAKATVLQQTARKSPRGVIARCRLWVELIDAKMSQATAGQPQPAMDPMMAGMPPGAAPMQPPMPMGPMSPDPMMGGGRPMAAPALGLVA